MFKAANPFDEIVTKATDENLTSENWELNLDVCDKVSSEEESGARNCVAAVQKRLVHRNANVQLYALTLSDTLSKNCGLVAHRELSSRSFTQTLTRIVADRNTHETVRKRVLALIKQWAEEFAHDESLGIMGETYESLKSQNYDFGDDDAPRQEPSSDVLRQEDEELRRALELSMHDQGGRPGWVSSYPPAGESSSSAGPSSSQTSSRPTASAGYVPGPGPNKALPDPNAGSRQESLNLPTSASPQPLAGTAPSAAVPSGMSGSSHPISGGASGAAAASAPGSGSGTDPTGSGVAGAELADQAHKPAVSRVRALYDFAPTEPGELAFSKGDIIRVLDSVYKDWWRGELRGEAGIFPVNYVEKLPDPTPADVMREAEMEARVFAQGPNIDRLLGKLRGLDPQRDNLAEDEELQELYQTSLSMRPKIVKLIDRYSQKMAELKSMNEKFVSARRTFDRMMEESLSKYNPGAASSEYTQARPEYAAQAQQQAVAQQQDYAQAWAQWYASQGYPAAQQAQQGQVIPGAAPAGHAQPQQSEADAYAQWYYAQQAHQQQGSSPQPPANAQTAAQPQYDYSQYYAQQAQQQQAQQQQAPQSQAQQYASYYAQTPGAAGTPSGENAPAVSAPPAHGTPAGTPGEADAQGQHHAYAQAPQQQQQQQYAQQYGQYAPQQGQAAAVHDLQQGVAALSMGAPEHAQQAPPQGQQAQPTA